MVLHLIFLDAYMEKMGALPRRRESNPLKFSAPLNHYDR